VQLDLQEPALSPAFVCCSFFAETMERFRKVGDAALGSMCSLVGAKSTVLLLLWPTSLAGALPLTVRPSYIDGHFPQLVPTHAPFWDAAAAMEYSLGTNALKYPKPHMEIRSFAFLSFWGAAVAFAGGLNITSPTAAFTAHWLVPEDFTTAH
jgi:hypothetical protein